MRPSPLYCTPQHHNLHDDNISHKQNPANSSLVTLLYSCRCSEVCFILVTNDTQLVNRLDPLGGHSLHVEEKAWKYLVIPHLVMIVCRLEVWRAFRHLAHNLPT